MTVQIDPKQFTAILLAKHADWMPVRSAEIVSIAGVPNWPDALGFKTDGDSYVYAPLSSIVGVKTRRRIDSPEEIKAAQQAAAERELRRFEFLVFGTRQEWTRLAEAQDWKCASGARCGFVDLRIAALSHIVGEAVLCSACSPLKARTGAEFDALEIEARAFG